MHGDIYAFHIKISQLLAMILDAAISVPCFLLSPCASILLLSTSHKIQSTTRHVKF